jgi:structural maintenance of chromosome 2
MKVEELVIDGFKSYATRTVISGWDPQFNCITGLNGSGKSNILDAICFVLGITTMATVRAQNLQDLIYKRGQAGVTKASVTIVFDNSDTATSPIGFEKYAQISVTRQIVLGGTSKYLINGHRAQQQTVQHLFQSVQLNINNPNFLIMQGRITKVLNMKPAEVLALIEEAAGTRMYEDRKEKALKTMAKKDARRQESALLLEEEIKPKLDKLRQEKKSFLEYQHTQSDLERAIKLIVAHDYIMLTQGAQEMTAAIEAIVAEKEAKALAVEQNTHEMGVLEQDIAEVKARQAAEASKDTNVSVLQKQAKAASHEVVRLNTTIDLKRSQLTEEEDSLASLEATDRTEELQKRQAEVDASQRELDAQTQRLDSMTKALESKRELLQSLQTGIASSAGKESGYQRQLAEAREQANDSRVAIDRAQMRISHLTEALKRDAPKVAKAESQNQSVLDKLAGLREAKGALEAEVERLMAVPGADEDWTGKERECMSRIDALSARIDSEKRQASFSEFTYARPHANFSASSVKGFVAELLTIGDENMDKCIALQVAAGGKLFNVVVDNEITGKELLQRGRLKRRVTMIPLNKIAAEGLISAERLAVAQQVAPGRVGRALELVGYSDEVAKAMAYVFGGTLVCVDTETAKKCAYHPQIRAHCVTLEGDHYSPEGTLSGGSQQRSGDLLKKLTSINNLTQELEEARYDLSNIQKSMAQFSKVISERRQLENQLSIREHEIKTGEKQLESSSSASVLRKKQEQEAELHELQESLPTLNQKLEDAIALIGTIERDMADFGKNKGSKLEELAASVEEMAAEVAQHRSVVDEASAAHEDIQVSLEQFMSDITGMKDEAEALKEAIQATRGGLAQLETQQDEARALEASLTQQVEEMMAALHGMDEERRSLEATLQQKRDFHADALVAAKEAEHLHTRKMKELEDASKGATAMEAKYNWVGADAHLFGKPGSHYDYESVDIKQVRRAAGQLEERIKGLGHKVNDKVMNMIDNVEKKEATLRGMIKTIEKDKVKIEQTIVSLNEYKCKALTKTWKKVSEDFGQIFATLLPGSFAKLVLLEGKEITEGLEIKVMLGKIWKESLAELSGGQRSLVALSLILALLQFKPAPMYILDEVDAALDLNHTQNIGHLIKTRFKGSQFIVVSLKEGFFSNANRVFKARFQEGSSSVIAM